MRSTYIFILAISFVLLASSFALAQSASSSSSNSRAQLNNITQQLVGTAFGQVSCKTNLTVSYLNTLATAIPNQSSALQSTISTLNSDTSQLKSLQGNATQFRSYVTGTYDPEFASVRGQVTSAIKAAHLGQNQTSLLRSQYQSIKSQYSTCAFASLKQYAQEKLQYYQTAVQLVQQDSSKYSAKGVSVTAVNSDIASANSTIIMPYQSAINSASNVTQLENAIKMYCLFDGCSKGLNGHFAARIAYDRTTAVIAKAQTYNLTANQTAAITKANGYLSSAQSVLSSAGTSYISQPTQTQLWNYLKNATAALKMGLVKR